MQACQLESVPLTISKWLTTWPRGTIHLWVLYIAALHGDSSNEKGVTSLPYIRKWYLPLRWVMLLTPKAASQCYPSICPAWGSWSPTCFFGSWWFASPNKSVLFGQLFRSIWWIYDGYIMNYLGIAMVISPHQSESVIFAWKYSAFGVDVWTNPYWSKDNALLPSKIVPPLVPLVDAALLTYFVLQKKLSYKAILLAAFCKNISVMIKIHQKQKCLKTFVSKFPQVCLRTWQPWSLRRDWIRLFQCWPWKWFVINSGLGIKNCLTRAMHLLFFVYLA